MICCSRNFPDRLELVLAFNMYVLHPDLLLDYRLALYVPYSTLRLVGVGLVLRLELEVLVCRAQEHLPERRVNECHWLG